MSRVKKIVLKLKSIWNTYVLRYFPSFFKLMWTFVFFSLLIMIFTPYIVSGMFASGVISLSNPDYINAGYYLSLASMYLVIIEFYIIIVMYIIGALIGLFFKSFKGTQNNYEQVKINRARKLLNLK